MSFVCRILVQDGCLCTSLQNLTEPVMKSYFWFSFLSKHSRQGLYILPNLKIYWQINNGRINCAPGSGEGLIKPSVANSEQFITWGSEIGCIRRLSPRFSNGWMDGWTECHKSSCCTFKLWCEENGEKTVVGCLQDSKMSSPVLLTAPLIAKMVGRDSVTKLNMAAKCAGYVRRRCKRFI